MRFEKFLAYLSSLKFSIKFIQKVNINISKIHFLRRTRYMRGNIEAARKAKQSKKNKNESNSKDRLIGRIKYEARLKQKKIEEYYRNIQQPQNQFLREMNTLERLRPRGRRYSARFIFFCVAIYLTSFTCYKLLLKFGIPLASISKISMLKMNLLSDNMVRLLHLSDVRTIIAQYKDDNNLENDSFSVILAVDAISFHPKIRIEKDGTINGALGNYKISKEKMNKLEKSFHDFEIYINSIKNVTITDAFVYQIQPIQKQYPCFVVHIEPSTQGKATEKEIDILLSIKQSIEDSNLSLIGIAFDGDSTYSKLHMEYFNSYNNQISKDYYFRNFSSINKLGIISDPLHMLKRVRYRFLKNKISANFHSLEPQLNINSLRKNLNIPEIVFSNEKFTKMHDNLPLKLFDLKNLVILFEANEYSWVSYMLPFSLFASA